MNDDRKKYIEQWWRKYEAMNELGQNWQPSPELFFEFFEFAYNAWLNSSKTAAQIEADIQHHIEMQKVFSKLRKAHGDKI